MSEGLVDLRYGEEYAAGGIDEGERRSGIDLQIVDGGKDSRRKYESYSTLIGGTDGSLANSS